MTDRTHYLVTCLDDNTGRVSMDSYHDSNAALKEYRRQVQAVTDCGCFSHESFTPLIYTVVFECPTTINLELTEFGGGNSFLTEATQGVTILDYTITHCEDA